MSSCSSSSSKSTSQKRSSRNIHVDSISCGHVEQVESVEKKMKESDNPLGWTWYGADMDKLYTDAYPDSYSNIIMQHTIFHWKMDYSPLKQKCDELAKKYKISAARVLMEFLMFMKFMELECNHKENDKNNYKKFNKTQLNIVPTKMIVLVWSTANSNSEFYKCLVDTILNGYDEKYKFNIPFDLLDVAVALKEYHHHFQASHVQQYANDLAYTIGRWVSHHGTLMVPTMIKNETPAYFSKMSRSMNDSFHYQA